MKSLTKNQVYFIISTIIQCAIFRVALAYCIQSESAWLIILSAVLFFISMFIAGWYFGKRDSEELPLRITSFVFHLSTYIIYHGISWVWYISFAPSGFHYNQYFPVFMLTWGVGLLIHYMCYKKQNKDLIKGIHKDDIF